MLPSASILPRQMLGSSNASPSFDFFDWVRQITVDEFVGDGDWVRVVK
ncbi:hypothetical protein BVRB_1g016370 [Beta vulgaris subsp. vulgaris]|nr:hypothetical protein BVRB_1g016370 [Beta vulgaris subsp. vulgaris]